MSSQYVNLRAIVVISKMIVFAFGCVIFMPLAYIMPPGEYAHGILTAASRYLDELQDCGYIDADRRKKLEDILYD